MPVFIPPTINKIITRYLNGDLNFNWSGDKKKKPFSAENRVSFRLFDKSITQLLTEKEMHTDSEAGVIGNLILRGEEKDASEALHLIQLKLKINPSYLDYAVIATDPLGRKVKGDFIQIAAMAGDFDLKRDIQDNKEHGLVERIAAIANLTSNEIALRVQVITTPEAKVANMRRNRRIVKAVKRFGEGLMEHETNKYHSFQDLKRFQNKYEPAINRLKEDLIIDTNKIITLGYIFDPRILQLAVSYFNRNANRFGGWSGSSRSDVFWINGIGLLQSKSSSRDAQAIRAGMGNLFEKGRIPIRRLEFFYNSTLGLGEDAFYDGYGRRTHHANSMSHEKQIYFWNNYIKQKQQNIEDIQYQTLSNQNNCCVVM